MSPILPPPPYPVSPDELRRAPALAERGDNATPETNEQSFSFSDFLSIINPLQHIPIVGSIYRAITGDTIKPTSRVIGGLLFGGPMGLVTSALNAMVEQTKGKDLGEQAIAMLLPDKGSPAPGEAQYADATPAPKNVEAALPQPLQPSQRPVEDAAVAPLSRSLFGFTPTQNPANALGGDRTLAASLRGPAPTAAPTAAQGRTIADYRNFSGRPLPVVDTNRSSSTHSAAVRLQPTAPMPEKPRTPATQGATESRPSDSAATSTAADTKAETSSAASPPLTSDWFAAAMARGLDRYREQHRAAPAATQIDTTL